MRFVALAGVLASGCFSTPGLTRSDGGAEGDGAIDVPVTGDANLIWVSRFTIIPGMDDTSVADAMCTADAAGLPANTYVAYLSTTTSSIHSRIMAAGARGWVRPDGKPVADMPSELGSGQHLYPPRLDPTGTDLGEQEYDVATGTTPLGGAASNCADYSQPTGTITVGLPDAYGGVWTESRTTSCNAPSRVYCLGIGKSARVEVTRTPANRIAFVSTTKVTGIQGRGAMDDACKVDALTRSELAGKTFLAAVAVPGEPIASRFSPGAPWERLDGVVVLTGQLRLLAPIALDVQAHPSDTDVWVGAPDFSTLATFDQTCAGWLGAGTTGLSGDSTRSNTSRALALNTLLVCSLEMSVYCLET